LRKNTHVQTYLKGRIYIVKKLSRRRKSFLTLTAIFVLMANLTLGPLAFAGGTRLSRAKKSRAKASQFSQVQDKLEVSPEGLRQMAALLA
jgi:hypothetical protein